MTELDIKEKKAREKKEAAECIISFDGFTYWCVSKTGMRKFRGRNVPTVYFKDVFTNRILCDWYDLRSHHAILTWKKPDEHEDFGEL